MLALYIVLLILSTISMIIMVASLAISFIMGFEESSLNRIFIISLIIGIGIAGGASYIRACNTTTTATTKQMEISKLDLTETKSTSTPSKVKYYMGVTDNGDNHFVIRVTPEEYVMHEVGDIVKVEIETKTVFDKEIQTAKLITK